jgi:hypothetical protein
MSTINSAAFHPYQAGTATCLQKAQDSFIVFSFQDLPNDIFNDKSFVSAAEVTFWVIDQVLVSLISVINETPTRAIDTAGRPVSPDANGSMVAMSWPEDSIGMAWVAPVWGWQVRL